MIQSATRTIAVVNHIPIVLNDSEKKYSCIAELDVGSTKENQPVGIMEIKNIQSEISRYLSIFFAIIFTSCQAF